MTIYFTSDLHFGHAKVIEYSRRPFPSLEAMEAALIENWNATVTKHDQVYVLGDFSMASASRTDEILGQLTGQKFLVRGNHDRGMKGSALARFAWVKDLYELKVADPETNGRQRVVLCHYALLTWNASHHGAWHLHGHSHGSLQAPGGRRLDVGVDCHGYRPISYGEVKAWMRQKEFRQVDHHAVRPRGGVMGDQVHPAIAPADFGDEQR